MSPAAKFEALRRACASKPHGQRARYAAGCRCMLCRAANSRYETERARARKTGDWNGMADAAEARRHLVWLSRRGIGRDAVAAASDIAPSLISLITRGQRLRIRARTARKLLAIGVDARADLSLVPAHDTWALINELLERGYSKAFLARQAGLGRSIQLGPRFVTALSASRIERLYQRIEIGLVSRDTLQAQTADPSKQITTHPEAKKVVGLK